ncbi:ROK family protein, partial [Lysobacter sp. 2RAB21]
TLYGVARHLDNFFYLHLSMGLGGSLIVGRNTYRGADGNATEIGHVPVVPGGTPCYCGNQGCLERYLSLHSLAEALGLDDAQIHTPDLLERLDDAEDQALQQWCQQAAQRLRDAICMIENMLDPQTIVIGGSAPQKLVQRLVDLAQPLHRSVRGRPAPEWPRVMISQREEDCSLLGAAVLPIHELLSPRLEGVQKDDLEELQTAELLGHRPSVGGRRI